MIAYPRSVCDPVQKKYQYVIPSYIVLCELRISPIILNFHLTCHGLKLGTDTFVIMQLNISSDSL